MLRLEYSDRPDRGIVHYKNIYLVKNQINCVFQIITGIIFPNQAIKTVSVSYPGGATHFGHMGVQVVACRLF